MFSRSETHYFLGPDPQPIVGSMMRVAYEQHALPLAQSGYAEWSATNQNTTYGFSPKLVIRCAPAPGGFTVSARFSMEPTPSAIIIGFLLYMVCFPIGLLFLWQTYKSASERQQAVLQSLWIPVAHQFANPFGGGLPQP